MLRSCRALGTLLLAGALAGCSMFGTGTGGGGGALSPGLTARLDSPGASLDRRSALDLVNAYRSTVSAAPLTADASLDAAAQSLAAQYAASGTPPKTPIVARDMRMSAGYANFAETFSGWRNSPADASALGNANFRRAGLGAVHDPNSSYGVYWVLLLAD